MKSLKIILLISILLIPASSYAKMGAHPNCEDVEDIAEMYFQYPSTYKAVPEEFIFQMSESSDCTMTNRLFYVEVGPTGGLFGSTNCDSLGDKKWSCNKGNVENSNFDKFQGAYYYYTSPCLMSSPDYTCEVRDIIIRYPEVVVNTVTRQQDDIVISGNATKTEPGWKLNEIIVSNMSCKIDSSGIINCGFPKTLVQGGKLHAKLISDQSNKIYMLMDVDVPSKLMKDCESGWSQVEQICKEDVPVAPTLDCKKTPLADDCDYDKDGIINKQDKCPKNPEGYYPGSSAPADGVLDGCNNAPSGSPSTSSPTYSLPYLSGESKCSFVENSRVSLVGLTFIILTLTIMCIGYSFVTVRARKVPRRKKMTKRIVDLKNL